MLTCIGNLTSHYSNTSSSRPKINDQQKMHGFFPGSVSKVLWMSCEYVLVGLWMQTYLLSTRTSTVMLYTECIGNVTFQPNVWVFEMSHFSPMFGSKMWHFSPMFGCLLEYTVKCRTVQTVVLCCTVLRAIVLFIWLYKRSHSEKIGARCRECSQVFVFRGRGGGCKYLAEDPFQARDCEK